MFLWQPCGRLFSSLCVLPSSSRAVQNFSPFFFFLFLLTQITASLLYHLLNCLALCAWPAQELVPSLLLTLLTVSLILFSMLLKSLGVTFILGPLLYKSPFWLQCIPRCIGGSPKTVSTTAPVCPELLPSLAAASCPDCWNVLRCLPLVLSDTLHFAWYQVIYIGNLLTSRGN